MVFLGILFEALPFVLIGVLVSSILHVFVSSEQLLRWLPKNTVGRMLFASCLGFLFPVCECGNVPVAKRLMLKGVPPYVAIMFLLAAPVVNPVVIVATMAAFRASPDIVVWRVVLTLIITWIVGWALRKARFEDVASHALQKTHAEHLHESRQRSECHEHADHAHAGEHCHIEHHEGQKTPMRQRLRHFVANALNETTEMLGVLMFGAFLASCIQLLMPRGVLMTLAADSLSSIVSMQVMAFIISICSNVDAFFILGLSTSLASPAILAFLVFGPMVDIKALVMLSRVFTSSLLVLLVAMTGLLTWALALMLAYLL